MAIMTSKTTSMRHLDINNIFLKSVITEEIYITVLKGIKLGGYQNTLYVGVSKR